MLILLKLPANFYIYSILTLTLFHFTEIRTKIFQQMFAKKEQLPHDEPVKHHKRSLYDSNYIYRQSFANSHLISAGNVLSRS